MVLRPSFLFFCSGITPGGNQRTLFSAGDQTHLCRLHVRPELYLLSYHSSHYIHMREVILFLYLSSLHNFIHYDSLQFHLYYVFDEKLIYKIYKALLKLNKRKKYSTTVQNEERGLR